MAWPSSSTTPGRLACGAGLTARAACTSDGRRGAGGRGGVPAPGPPELVAVLERHAGSGGEHGDTAGLALLGAWRRLLGGRAGNHGAEHLLHPALLRLLAPAQALRAGRARARVPAALSGRPARLRRPRHQCVWYVGDEDEGDDAVSCADCRALSFTCCACS